MRKAIAAAFLTMTRDQWAAHFLETDACVAPVLSLAEAARHGQSIARRGFVDLGGFERPAPAPRFSATPSAPASQPAASRLDASRILSRRGFSAVEIETLRQAAVVA